MYNAEKQSRMKIIILFLLITTSIYGQNSELISDGELCEQIESAIEYLKSDKELGPRTFKFASTMENGSLYNFFFPVEYVAYQLGTEKEKVFEFDKAKTYPIFKKLDSIKYQNAKLNLDCMKKKSKPNAKLSKLDKASLVINITTKRIGKPGSSGKAYLFFFKNRKIVKTYKTSWIE